MDYKEFFSKYRYNRKTDLVARTRFGAIYVAQSTKRDQQVFLRVMPVSDDEQAASLKAEAEFADNLPANPYIIRYQRVYRFEEATGDIDVAVMPYYPLGSLNKVLLDWKLDNEERRGLRDRILEAAAFLRANGVNLGIFDPSTIYISEEGEELIPHLTDISGVEGDNPDYEKEVTNLLPVTDEPENEVSESSEQSAQSDESETPEVHESPEISEEDDREAEQEIQDEELADAVEEADETARETHHGRWIYVVGVLFTWIAIFVLIFVLHRKNNPGEALETSADSLTTEQPAVAVKTPQQLMQDSLRADSLAKAAAAAAEQARADSIREAKAEKAKEEKAKKAEEEENQTGDWTDSKKMTPEEEAAYNEKARKEETAAPATTPEPVVEP